jgi:DnaK suppressor protein
MSPMKENDLLKIQRILTEQLDELKVQADSTFSGLIDEAGSRPDLADQAGLEAERENLLRKRGRENRLMRDVVEALQRIKEKTYGICDLCGEEIAVARLKAQPLATLCIACKTEMEKVEKQSS